MSVESTAGNGLRRRPHLKSRSGCRQCKQRKVKCDEARPSCSRCTTRRSQCSYLEPHIRLPSPPTHLHPSATGLSPRPSGNAIRRGSIHHSSPNSSTSSLQLCGSALDERYSLLHLELLQHFRGPLMADTLSIQPGLDAILDLVYREAFRAPYLMDELLAFAAAHKSLTADQRRSYQIESTRLQTRALGQFNLDHQEVTEENCVALFTFSTLLGQHVIFDVFSTLVDLSSVLDRLVHCINLHHGIRVIASRSREQASALFQDLVPADSIHMAADVSATSGVECNDLLRRLRGAEMAQSSIGHYEDAVKILQYLFDTSRRLESRRIVVVQEWLVRLPGEYVSLLAQRRPEALVVVAYYGVLLHGARDYWPIGNGGRFLIQSISNHLGDYWADWLRWPNEAL